jgi:serine/threonine protein kinase
MTSQSADRPACTVADLLRDLARSRVLDGDRARSLLAELAPGQSDDPATVLDFLVGRGELTRFQADKLIRGQWQNLVLGKYVILGPLGRGGMGFVYLARDRAGADPLALKILSPTRAAEQPRTLARFRREMEIGLRLPEHPHLTRTLDAGEAAGAHYLAMEYVPGKTVRQLVGEGGPLTPGLAARVFADVAIGLAAAHAAGFIHRDLKPANIIVTPDSRAKLLDFGFALVRGESTPTDPTLLGGPGYTLGTMDYLPPEQAIDPVGVGPTADLYALGCSLFYALAGCPPFPGGSVRDKLRWHRTDPPPPLGHFNPAVPAGLVELIDRLMAKRVEDRPSSAAEVARELNQWADPIRPVRSEEPHRSDLYRRLDAVWHETQAGRDGAPEAVTPAEPVERSTAASASGQLPRWLVGVAIMLLGGIMLLAAMLGWLVAQFRAG